MHKYVIVKYIDYNNIILNNNLIEVPRKMPGPTKDINLTYQLAIMSGK